MVAIILGVATVAALAVGFVALSAMYNVVDPSKAHMVIKASGKTVIYSADDSISTSENKSSYFFIPEWVPFIGMTRKIIDVTIKEIVDHQETYEKSQARYCVDTSLKYRINNVSVNGQTSLGEEDVAKQLREVISSTVRDVTIKYTLVEVRANKSKVEDEIEELITKDLNKWGLYLVNFQLVNFADTKHSTIVSDISEREEKRIAAETRIAVAERDREAKIKEAENREMASVRELLEKQKVDAQAEASKVEVAKQEEKAKEAHFKVVKVEEIKRAEIDKEKAKVVAEQIKEVALIKANELKDAEEINKQQKKLSGEGDKIKAEEIAKGNAAKAREEGLAEAEAIEAKGLAEAKAKNELQKALNLFGDDAIKALIAEKEVAKDEAIGIATAQALANAEVKVFSGSDNRGGFDLGKTLSALQVADPNTAKNVGNNIARPNDVGLVALAETRKDKKE